MPGGNPDCGDVVTIYLKGGPDHHTIVDVTFKGEGCTISQAAASVVMEMVHDGRLTMAQILAMDYNALIDSLGREVVAARPRCATLALGTLKAAIKKYQWDHRIVPDAERADGDESAEQGLVFGDRASRPAGA
jgi:nitrogen fixation NifU-like protein